MPPIREVAFQIWHVVVWPVRKLLTWFEGPDELPHDFDFGGFDTRGIPRPKNTNKE